MTSHIPTPKTTTKHHDQPPSAAVQNVEKNVKPAQALLKKFSNDRSMNLAAALAYNLLLATVPVVAAMLAILGFGCHPDFCVTMWREKVLKPVQASFRALLLSAATQHFLWHQNAYTDSLNPLV